MSIEEFIQSEAARILLHSRPEDVPTWITDDQKAIFGLLTDDERVEIERLYQESLRPLKGCNDDKI